MVLILFKLLVTDVDGTLLDHNSKLSELNIKALKDCIKNGIDVIIATGKSINSIIFIIKELDLKLPQITLGGAVTVTPEKKIINAIKIHPTLYLDVIERVREKGYEPLVATVDGLVYCQQYSEPMKHVIAVGENIIKADNIKSEYFVNDTVSISIPINEKDPLDLFIRQTYQDKLQVVRSGEYFFDILNLKASKGNALKNLATELGIKKEEVVSFGDSHNDISLFKNSGFKIAVKNSYPELLEIADVITDANYNSGLGKAIYKYILCHGDV